MAIATRSLDLAEWTPATVTAPAAVVRAIGATFDASITPLRDATPSSLPSWEVRPRGVVGVAMIAGWQVTVRPRIPVGHVLWMAGVVDYRRDAVALTAHHDLHTALAQLFIDATEHALRQGVLRGYRERRTDLATVRGRVDVAEQVRRRPGQGLPLAVVYEEHDEDILENQLLLAAARSLGPVVADAPALRRGLHRIRAGLVDVSPITVDPRDVPPVVWTRLNSRYRPAVELARLILARTGVEASGGATVGRALTLTMHAVFEDFLARELGARLEQRDGRAVSQDGRWWLDVGREVHLIPDLVWEVAGAPAAVIDAKYQFTGVADRHASNVHQLLAYCTSLGLPCGHVVYAGSRSALSGPVRVVRGGPTIYAHALDLSVPPAQILVQLDDVARAIAAAAELRGGRLSTAQGQPLPQGLRQR